MALGVDDQVLVLGGSIGGLYFATTMETYDVSTGQWTSAAAPVRPGGGATAVMHRVLIAGGARYNGFFQGFSEANVYDVRSRTWASAGALSEPRHVIGATSVGSLALFAGGLTGYNGTILSDVVDIYDVDAGSWSIAHLSSARARVAAATAGSYALFAGGITAAGTDDRVDVYDHATGQWSTQVLPSVRGQLTAGSLGEMAVFTDGVAVDVFDAATGGWRSMALPTPRERLSVAVTSLGTKLFFAGGEEIPFRPIDTVDVFDVATGRWSTERLSVGRGYVAAASAGSRVLFCGGRVTPPNGPGSGISGVVDVYDDSIGTQYCTAAQPNSTGDAGRMHVIGFPGAVNQRYATFLASDLPADTMGFFLNSRAQAHVAQPGGSQGTLCLGGAIGRHSATPFMTDALGQGELRIDLFALPRPTGAVGVTVGETWNFQAWYRDVNPGPTSNFTDAVSVTFQ